MHYNYVKCVYRKGEERKQNKQTIQNYSKENQTSICISLSGKRTQDMALKWLKVKYGHLSVTFIYLPISVYVNSGNMIYYIKQRDWSLISN